MLTLGGYFCFLLTFTGPSKVWIPYSLICCEALSTSKSLWKKRKHKYNRKRCTTGSTTVKIPASLSISSLDKPFPSSIWKNKQLHNSFTGISHCSWACSNKHYLQEDVQFPQTCTERAAQGSACKLRWGSNTHDCVLRINGPLLRQYPRDIYAPHLVDVSLYTLGWLFQAGSSTAIQDCFPKREDT